MRWAMGTAGAVWDAVMLPLDLIDAAIDELREWLMGIFVDPILGDEWWSPEDYARARQLIDGADRTPTG